MDTLTTIFILGAFVSLCFGLYFVVKKKFWFPGYPLFVLSIAFAGAAKKEWKQLLTYVISLLILYAGWTIVVIYLKKLKGKREALDGRENERK